MTRRRVLLVIAAIVALAGCSTALQDSQRRVWDNANRRAPYEMKNDVEFNNYSRRQQIADDPTTILWCTSAFPVTGAPLFTVPIVGKLTSGGKRPYEGDPEKNIGPDGMFGHSGEYRYGFGPDGVYSDFYSLCTYCTSEPSVWQKESTELVLKTDEALFQAQQAAREALAAGNPEEAQRILEEAIAAAGGN